MDIHQAETQAADMKDRKQAADLSQRKADAPDAWDLYWRVRMGIDWKLHAHHGEGLGPVLAGAGVHGARRWGSTRCPPRN